MQITYIYGLKDPRDDKFYYVGRTNNPTRRNYEHHSRTQRPYSVWHKKMYADGVKPLMIVLCETTGNGFAHEIMWMKKLRDEGHPLVNIRRRSVGQTSTKSFGPLKSEKQIKSEQAQRIAASWRRWYNSLTPDEKSEYQRKKMDNGGKERMIAAQKGRKIPTELLKRRTALVTKALAQPEAKRKMQERSHNFWNSMTPEERKEFCRKRWESAKSKGNTGFIKI